MPKRAAPMPQSLRIGPYDYTLRVDPSAILDGEATTGSCSAFTDLRKQEMVFASTVNSQHTVLHEILHVLADHSGLDVRLGNDRAEDVIQSLDHLLLDVLRDNPHLLEYLTGG